MAGDTRRAAHILQAMGGCTQTLRVCDLPLAVLLTTLQFLPNADLLAFVCTCRSFRATVQAQNQYAAESVAGGLVARPVKRPPVAHIVKSVALYEWAQRDFGFSQFDERLVSATARSGCLELLQQHRRRCGGFWTGSAAYRWSICGSAAAGGHVPILEWARANGCNWNDTTCSSAAENGHLATLQWLRANGCRWDTRVCADAAANGHLEIIQWARANGCAWGWMTCANAAKNGHLEILKWARMNACPWNERTCSWAAGSGNLRTLQWARANGCPWDKNTRLNATKNGHWSVVLWALSYEAP